MLNWAQQFNTFCFLDNHQYQLQHHTEECLCGVGYKSFFVFDAGMQLNDLQDYIDTRQGKWLFGHLSYELQVAETCNTCLWQDKIGFPDSFFFEPEIIIRLGEKTIEINAADPKNVFQQIQHCYLDNADIVHEVKLQNRISREEYISIIQKLLRHIHRGDCYEINFCQEFFAEEASISPLGVYETLSRLSPNPFSALYRVDDKWLICASPERYLKKTGSKILSQPIKGTAKRELKEIPDERAKNYLETSSKERSENVMIVDLARNDLSRVCEKGSVVVEELFGIYAFPQLYQMISTVSGQLKADIKFTDILEATFPMGSMTGAPKKRVMELIQQYERSKRGIFSGALGYIAPSGDFDFNVVIRSLMYNTTSRYLSYQAGSGITFNSNAESEWEECLVKAEAITRVLQK